MTEKQGIDIPKLHGNIVKEADYEKLYASTIIHEKPLINALGDDYKKILTPSKVRELFMMI